jgi:NAD(P)H-dependent flavin oxidoreductase YrpB (nitropropane dioxygenase family)
VLKSLEELIIDIGIKTKTLPILEGGRGIGISTGITAGNFALNNCVGTFSGVNPDIIDGSGKVKRILLKAKTRLERHLELLKNSISGIMSHASVAKNIACGHGRIHMNVLWEMAGTEKILHEVLSRLKGVISGVVCGAGLPYRLGDICAKYMVNYFPIVSSVRAFRVLWKKSYQRTREWLGAVIYECPWRAGGHNGLSNNEDPFKKGNTYERVRELRSFMNEVGLKNIFIVVAGGVWNIAEYENFLVNNEIGKIAFQFGTRPLLTRESPISDNWKRILRQLNENDIVTNNFSPTGFYSSAINNFFLKNLTERNQRQAAYADECTTEFNCELPLQNGRIVFIRENDLEHSNLWLNKDYNVTIRTPAKTILFLNQEEYKELNEDMKNCSGCLSRCQFSTWQQDIDGHTTGLLPDFRKMCIQKALQNAKNNENFTQQLYFAGSEAYRFKTDPLYRNNHIPSIKELVSVLLKGK